MRNVARIVMGAALALTACGGGSSSSAPAGSGAAAASGKGDAKAAGAKVIEIKKLGIKGTAPGETEAPIIGDGDTILIGASKFTVTLSAAKDIDPKTIKDAKSAAELFKPTNQKEEALKDGWTLTYENTGSAGANYFVNSRRDIDGKGILCDTMQSTADQQKAALEFCKSLTKL